MDHHVLHVHRDHRVSVLVDLTSAPGRTVVFTRTKHGAKNLARQLNSRGVPTVELHGNLAQNARTRNMEAFHSGKATTLVATDIAARGIHVDDVALVVHADPPAEHKAYLHRSGRTARAGAAGTVDHADDRPAGQGRPRPDPRGQDLRRPRRRSPARATRCSRSSLPVSGCSSPVASRTTDRPRTATQSRGGGGGGGRRRSGGRGGQGGQGSGRSQGESRSRQQGGRSRGGNRGSGCGSEERRAQRRVVQRQPPQSLSPVLSRPRIRRRAAWFDDSLRAA